jgi:NADH-quinone oxidoreductase subunit J
VSPADAIFVIVASTTAASALGVALSRSVIHSAVWLLFTLIGVAILYLLLGAEFLAAAQLIVYVGGTMVLVVFGVMLTSGGPYGIIRTSPVERVIGGIIALMLAGLVVLAVRAMLLPTGAGDRMPGIAPLGTAFLGVTGPANPSTAYLLPFEFVSIHLLVVLIAAAYLARAKQKAVSPS